MCRAARADPDSRMRSVPPRRRHSARQASSSSSSSAAAPSAPQIAQMAAVASALPTVSTAPSAAHRPRRPAQAQRFSAAAATPARHPRSISNNSLPQSVNTLAQNVGVDPSALVNLASDYLVWVNGEVLSPGPLLAQSGTSLSSILEAAGGLQRQADLSGVTVTSTEIDPERGTSRTLRNTYAQSQTDFAQSVPAPVRFDFGQAGVLRPHRARASRSTDRSAIPAPMRSRATKSSLR